MSGLLAGPGFGKQRVMLWLHSGCWWQLLAFAMQVAVAGVAH